MQERQKLKLKCADEKSYFLSLLPMKIHLLTLSNARRHLIPTAVSSLCFALSGLCIIQKRIMNAFKIPVYIVNWIWIQSELKNNAFIQIWIQGSRIKMVEFKGSAVNNISFQYEITHKHVYCHATNGVFPEF